VTFLGDTHPAFQGSVVKAVASAKRTYPQIVKLLGERVENVGKEEEYLTFRQKLEELLQTTVASVQRHTPTLVEVQIRAPLVAQKFQPGQFFRIQNFETTAPVVKGTRLQTEAMAMRCAGVDPQQGLISVMVLEQGSSSRLCAQWRPHQPIALMGPTGAKANLPKGGETVMVIGDQISLAEVRTLGPALRATGNRVLYVGCVPTAEEVYGLPQLEAATDALVWITATGSPVLTRRPQDCSASGNLLEVLLGYARWELGLRKPIIPFQEVTRVLIIGNHRLVHLLEEARRGILRDYFSQSATFTASVHGPMQCMLKGVCAQCLLWQVDPVTKQRTKAVFACSWQDQPLEMIDLENLEERLSQNRLQEQLSGLWLEYLLGKNEET
jgi:NAD(P)H-flavin reductase